MCFIENDETVIEGPSAHKGERGYFHHTAFEILLGVVGAHHVMQGVEQRTQIRVDLGHQIAGQKPEPLPCFNCRARQDDPLYRFTVQSLHRHRHSEPTFSGARWP